jgi:selenocysteine-specific elongation factor
VIVATAGHVNHGKTALVAALTGIDTDSLPEEKRRGLTIDLGFAHHVLPDGRVASFIDVPGHERFVRNMLAGVTAIDAALFVVAADDGPMPQTLEHLAILDLLGVSHGLVALTKADRVPPGRLAETGRAVAAILAGTSLGTAPVVPVSSVTGDGIQRLREALSGLAEMIAARPTRGQFRLAIDRAFLVQGTGLVVTGSVFSGRVAVGDRLTLCPRGIEVRVRGIHADNHAVDGAVAGQRCALNLAGSDVRKPDIRRGDWVLAAAAHAPTARVDARIRVLAGEARALAHWTPAHLHLGAADTTCRVAVLGAKAIPPGRSALVQLVLDRPLGALHGDRLILRDQAARRTVAGGHLVDPFPPRRGRARPERLARLAILERQEPEACLRGLLDLDPSGVDLEAFARARNLTAEEGAALWSRAGMVRIPGAEPATGFSPAAWAALRAAIVEALGAWHARQPEELGPVEDEVRRALGQRTGPAPVRAALAELLGEGAVRRRGAVLHLPGHEARLSAADAALWDRVRPALAEGGSHPPVVWNLAAALGMDAAPLESFLVRAARQGYVQRVARNRFYLPAAIASLAAMAEAVAADVADGLVTPAAYRDRSGIGRNLTIDVLEYFDRVGLTARTSAGRRVLRPADEVFGSPAS